MINQLVEQLVAYQSGQLSRLSLEEFANQSFSSVAERMKQELRINDIFLYHVLINLTTVPEQAYQGEEIDKLIRALKGEAVLSYPWFCHIPESMLTDYAQQILQIANDFLERMKKAAAEGVSYPWLSDANSMHWRSILRTRTGVRREFTEITMVPDWIANQIEYLLWIGMSDRIIALLNLDRMEIAQKIEHYCSVLAGQKNAFLVIGNNFVSVL